MTAPKATKDCVLWVKEGKVWCEKHAFKHKSQIIGEMEPEKCPGWVDWKGEWNKGPHKNVGSPAFRHILYVAWICNYGRIHLDSEV